jgi:hypothetical protein
MGGLNLILGNSNNILKYLNPWFLAFFSTTQFAIYISVINLYFQKKHLLLYYEYL